MSAQPSPVSISTAQPRNTVAPILYDPPAEGDAAPLLRYAGGPVLSSVQIVTVFWGRFWELLSGAQLAQHINEFFDFALGSALIDALAEYSTPASEISRGSVRANYSDFLNNPGKITSAGQVVTDEEIQKALHDWIASRHIPEPGRETAYFVYLSPSTIVRLGTHDSENNFCGYHSSFPHLNRPLYYAVQPFLSGSACSYGSDLDSLTKVASHLLQEVITDPELNGWFDPRTGYEIGDIGNSKTKRLKGYLVQPVWSNQQQALRL